MPSCQMPQVIRNELKNKDLLDFFKDKWYDRVRLKSKQMKTEKESVGIEYLWSPNSLPRRSRVALYLFVALAITGFIVGVYCLTI